MKLTMRATALGKKVTLFSTAFILAVSSLTAVVPFVLSQQASALQSVNTVTASDVTADSMTLHFNVAQSIDSMDFDDIVPGAASGSFDIQVDNGPINNYTFETGTTDAPFSNVHSFVQVREEFIADDYTFVKGDWQKFYVVTDTTAPAAPTITAPGTRTWHKTTPIATSWTAVSDPSGVSYQVAYKYDDGHSFSASTCPGVTIDGSAVYCRTTTQTSRNHQPSANEQGGVTVWVRAIDGAGNVGPWSTSVHYYYDATPPVTDITVDNLVDNTVGNSFTVSGNASDNLGLNRVNIQLVSRVDGKRYGNAVINLIPFGTSHHWTQAYNATTLGLPEGPAAAIVTVVDMAGNAMTTSWTANFLVDKTGPNVAVDPTPAEGATVADGTVTITGTAESDDFGWYRYQLLDENKNPVTYSIAGGSTAVVNGTLGTIDIDNLPAGPSGLQALTDGTYYVRVWAQDKYGNQVGTKNAPYIAQFTVARTPEITNPGGTGGGTTTDTDTTTDTTGDGTTDGTPAPFVAPAAINPGAIASVLGDTTNTPSTSDTSSDPASDPGVEGASTEKTLAAAVNNTDGNAFGLAWYWWLLIVAALAAFVWWIVAGIRGRQAEN